LLVSYHRLEGILLSSPLVADAAVIGVHSEEQATELPRAYSESFSLSIELRRLIFTPSALISSRTFAERK
jgi:hypothetical protein